MSKRCVFVLCIVFKFRASVCEVLWENLRCSSDAEQATPEGVLDDMGRFPWYGIVQHTFYLGGKIRFAVTNGVLIHPEYVIAPAEDIARIQPELLTNNTKFIVWQSKTVKYSLDIDNYYLPPEYTDGVTLASIALLQILTYGEGGPRAPVLPVCLPVKGAGTFTSLYAVKMTDGKYITCDRRAEAFFAQSIEIAIQRGNAASIRAPIPRGHDLYDNF